MDQHTYSEKPSVFTPRVLKISAIGLRIPITIFLFLSLIILIIKVNTIYSLTVDSGDYNIDYETLHFYDVVGYRYMTPTIVTGGAYSIWQTVTTVVRLKKGYEENLVLEYGGDKVLSIALATGSVAGFLATAELQKNFYTLGKYTGKFYKMGYAADGFLFLGFICASILSELLSSYALPRRF